MCAWRTDVRMWQDFGRHLLETTQTDITHLAQLYEAVDFA